MAKFMKVPLQAPARNPNDDADFTLTRSMADQCRDAMKINDIIPPEIIYEDGKLHRFQGSGKAGKLNGWYVIHEYCGNFGDWKQTGSEGINFNAKFDRELTDSEREQIRLQNEATKQAVQKAQDEKYEETAKWCQDKWEVLEEASLEHPYLKKKGIHNTFGLRMDKSSLVMPLYNFYGKITTVQFINPDGKKHNKTGGRIKGSYWVVGRGEVEFIAEGFATAAAVAQETGRCCAIAVAANNIPVIASYFPSATIVVDDDDPTNGRPEGTGLFYAKQTNSKYVLCSRSLGKNPKSGYDANDYMLDGGDLCKLLGCKKPEKRFKTLEEVIKQDAPIEWLVQDLIPAGNKLMMVFGASGEGKTYFVIDWMLSIATGRDWHGVPVQQGNVLYLCGEGQKAAYERMAAWVQYYGINPKGVPFAIDEKQSALDREKSLVDLMSWIDEELCSKRPDFVCIDTLSLYMEGDENNTQESNMLIKNIKTLSNKYNCCICLVHHKGVGENAANRSRGSSVIKATMDSQIMIEKKDKIYVFHHTKNKAGVEMPEMRFSLNVFPVEGWYDKLGNQRENGVMMPIAEKPNEIKQGGEVVFKTYTEYQDSFLEAFDTLKFMDEKKRYCLKKQDWAEWIRTNKPGWDPSYVTNPKKQRGPAETMIWNGEISYIDRNEAYYLLSLSWEEWDAQRKLSDKIGTCGT